MFIADQVELESLTGSQIATPVFAGFMTGGLYKCTAGPRGTALAAAIGMFLCSNCIQCRCIL